MKPTCRCPGNRIVIAEMPIRNIDKGSVTTEFIAAVLVNKYCDHLPVYRQVRRMFKSMKLDIAESSVCRWRDQIAEQLTDLRDLMKSEIMRSHCINTDASPAPIRLPNEKNRVVKGNMYVYVGGKDRPYNVFDVQPNQSAPPIHEFLQGYAGNIQCDAHANYNVLFTPKITDPKRPPPKEVGCHAHCRHHFVDAETDEPILVDEFLKLYRRLYKIEKDGKEFSNDIKNVLNDINEESNDNNDVLNDFNDASNDNNEESNDINDVLAAARLQRRRRDALPVLDALFQRCRDCLADPRILPKSPLGKACAYALNNEIALRRYCNDGRLAIDNNISERTLKDFVLSRKNWMFFGSSDAARYSAIIMSVLSSARRHGLNEWEYLTDVLYRLSDWNPKRDSLQNLLPDRWKKSPTPPTEAATIIAR
jgi:hypothetical protein